MMEHSVLIRDQIDQLTQDREYLGYTKFTRDAWIILLKPSKLQTKIAGQLFKPMQAKHLVSPYQN